MKITGRTNESATGEDTKEKEKERKNKAYDAILFIWLNRGIHVISIIYWHLQHFKQHNLDLRIKIKHVEGKILSFQVSFIYTNSFFDTILNKTFYLLGFSR